MNPPRTVSSGAESLLEARQRLISPSLRLAYRRPLHLVRGEGAYLFDADGREYLDCVNNVCHVGHGHPRVIEAACRQWSQLNTNTRVLYEGLTEYAHRLTATLPEPLRVCWFVNSGSEANDLALRIARTWARASDVVVVDQAYHGHTASLVEISPYKFDGPGGAGRPPHVQVIPMPDPFRGRYRGANTGARYAEHAGEAIRQIALRGARPAAFFCESILSCAGQIVLPSGFVAGAARRVRDEGGLYIADEVQVGFGRVGTHFWGFETHGVVPDIVTMGKPIGNGFPLGAVVTTPEIAAAFANGMEYFNTFGGNPVACAVGLAVLDVIRDEGLQTAAHRNGEDLINGFREMATKHPRIGDVRGNGLFVGVEIVDAPGSLRPDAVLAADIVNHACDEGVLLSTDGPNHNVLKIKPPMVFGRPEVERLLEVVQRVLQRVG